MKIVVYFYEEHCIIILRNEITGEIEMKTTRELMPKAMDIVREAIMEGNLEIAIQKIIQIGMHAGAENVREDFTNQLSN